MGHVITKFLEHSTKDYTFDKSCLQPLINNARKWTEKDFIEEYVDYHDFSIRPIDIDIKKGDEVNITQIVRDESGKQLRNDMGTPYTIPFRTVIAEKDYGNKRWEFILDHTKDIQEEAKETYHINKDKKKRSFPKGTKTVTAYHASPYLFKNFHYTEERASGQPGSHTGFFFLLDEKRGQQYAKGLKTYKDKVYLYECQVATGRQLTLDGEKIGVGWGRAGELESAEGEGYDTVIIRNADTGMGGITDELVVFDDDNIRINKVTEI